MMLLAPDAFSNLDQITEKENVSCCWGLAVTIPRRCTIIMNLSCRDFSFEDGEGFFELLVELWSGAFLQLRFRIMEIIDIDTLQAKVAQALLNLCINIPRSDAVPIDNIISSG